MQFVSNDPEAAIAIDGTSKIVYQTSEDCEVQYGLRLIRAQSTLIDSGEKTAIDLQG